MNPEQIWQAAQEELRFQLSKPSYETWLKNASLVGREKNAFKIGVPTKLAKDWLEDRYSAMIKETLSAIVSGDVSVAFEVVPGQPEPLSRRSAVAVAEEPPHEEEEPVLAEASQLNPKFQFQHFVVGNNSRFAHAACRAVAETPAKAYNPLFLYGGVGLGKTHLMHAIGHAVLEKHHRRRVAYVTSEKFMNEMISSIQEGRMNDFRTRYRTVDVLLVDDIQFLAGKDRTQDVIPSTETRTLSMETISRTVANFYHISLEEMKGKRRDKHIVFPRQVALYLIREETASSLPAIGQAFGGRDHTTVLHSYEKISTDSKEDQRLQADLRKLRELLYSH